ncbi:glucan 1,3-beta-glucosidase [Paracoccidioides lutzii Pb01]|uniref:glucan 1,3-beta-glucosidase n=5 Tax=Paracoccidioides TaxID=38946 RepID=C1H4T0_PARBA|nr:glucan 1,3-beta-glucosidase [Paracoccidioides lutzii Pb01]EEH34724.1 glucan 1,3-beta-glucosidase [Paracoccidioides lutzii Pb01]
MNLSSLNLALASCVLAWVSLASASSHVTSHIVPRQAKSAIYGVNLGGWLLLEPWITPSVFEAGGSSAVDEYTLSKNLGSNAKTRLSKHWSTFITADDFKQIAAAGLTHVRIPIGYWAVSPIKGEPYVQGQVEYLDKALVWAKNSNLKVVIDLHGAPGSQNGFDNSGRRGPINWQKGDTVKQTLAAIRALANRYAKRTDVVNSIELVNEPFVPGGVQLDPLRKFYKDGYAIVRGVDSTVGVAISDGFQPPRSWNGFMAPKDFKNVHLDTHHYQVFDDAFKTFTIDQHVKLACSLPKDRLSGVDKPLIVGEWSGAMTDCAKYLNGRGRGARFDNSYPSGKPSGACGARSTGSSSKLSAQQKKDTRRYIEAQLDAFKVGAGWFFWTWKTEGAPGWDMRDLLKQELFPQPFSARKYGGCK